MNVSQDCRAPAEIRGGKKNPFKFQEERVTRSKNQGWFRARKLYETQLSYKHLLYLTGEEIFLERGRLGHAHHSSGSVWGRVVVVGSFWGRQYKSGFLKM